MKILKINITLALLAANTAYATTPTPTPQSGGGTQSEIGAHINVVKDSIEDSLRKLESRNIDMKFNSRDYWAQLPAFKRNVALSVDEFMREMGNERSGLLGRLALSMNRFNSIYHSKSFSAEQKEILLQSAKLHVMSEVDTVQLQYQSRVKDTLMKATGGLPLFFDTIITPVNKKSNEMNCSVNPKRSKSIHNVFYRAFDSVNNLKRVLFETCAFLDDGILYSHYDTDAKKPVNPITFSNFHEQGLRHGHRVNIISGVWKGRSGTIAGLSGSHVDVREYSWENSYMSAYGNEVVSHEATQLKKAFYSRFYEKTIFPILSQGCIESTLCISLRSGDLYYSLGLLNDSINRNVEVKLADGTPIVLKKVPIDLKYILTQIERVDYPVSLPFESN